VTAYLWDDVPAIREIVRLALEEDLAVRVVGEAGDAEPALREICSLQPDVVVLDLAMPGMDGLEALPLIRDLAPDACVVVLSGFSADRMAAVALAHGASHYVEKGDDLAELRRVVRDCQRVAA
jgi:two-component system, chemotaxis family, chemotaxis protein CheY